MIAPRAARVQVGGLEHGADAGRRPLELGEPATEDERAAVGRLGEAEQHAQRRRLPGAVRAEEARDAAGLDLEERSLTAVTSPKRFVNSTADRTAAMRGHLTPA